MEHGTVKFMIMNMALYSTDDVDSIYVKKSLFIAA